MGLHRAGFDVVGIDNRPQPRYPAFHDAPHAEHFRFILADALRPPVRLEAFDLIWASPPCQRYTRVWRGQEQRRSNYPDLIGCTREMLSASGVAWCMENVPGAPLRPDVVLEGGMFGLRIVRQRVFELSGFSCPFEFNQKWAGMSVTNGDLASVAGNGCNNAWNLRRAPDRCKWRDLPEPLKARLKERNSAAGWRAAMGIDWMTRDEIKESVPPAYAEWIGRAALQAMEHASCP